VTHKRYAHRVGPRPRRIIKLVGLAAIGVVLGLAIHRCYRHFRGIKVCLHNVDSRPLRATDVVVRSRFSSRSYQIGDLTPGDTACVWVKANDEAGVITTFRTPSGASKVIELDGYVEQSYSGYISAEVTVEGEPTIDQDIDYFF
jgi:hypothetical protein